MECLSLKGALERIESLYQQTALQPGTLREIDFVNRWTVVLTREGQIGQAFNFTGEHAVYGLQDPSPLVAMQSWIGTDLVTIAHLLLTKQGLLWRSLCLAVLNALSRPFATPQHWEAGGWRPAVPYDFSFLHPHWRVVVIGYGGLVQDLLAHCRQVHVSDMRPLAALRSVSIGSQLLYGPPGVVFHAPQENEALLRDADAVFLTGSTLVNDTWRSLLAAASQARVKGMFGPSAQLLPEVLRAEGVNYLVSQRVLAPAAYLQQLLNRMGGQAGEPGLTESYAWQAF